MSKIKNGGLDQYGAEPFERQQFGTAGVEVVNGQLSVANVQNTTHNAAMCVNKRRIDDAFSVGLRIRAMKTTHVI